MKINCKICEQECEITEATRGYGFSSEDIIDVYFCKNKKCENYDKTLEFEDEEM